ncbi:hypothetical protein G5V59_07335 [Nocardioides sp. W3-2-3]|uniref:hypothetical protein n=1 Tax=Nocardioides convexus TaxID=2712224 RepID=UPI00241860DE|nr:hypothetical protein [Nocardioides convexus]NHA00057.1 hypothetical protein [Nocardioides convexus]
MNVLAQAHRCLPGASLRRRDAGARPRDRGPRRRTTPGDRDALEGLGDRDRRRAGLARDAVPGPGCTPRRPPRATTAGCSRCAPARCARCASTARRWR